MAYDFDTEHPRLGTNSVKWDFLVRDGKSTQWTATDPALGDDRVLPMWVADMDFPIAPNVMEAMRRRLDHPFLGYSAKTKSYDDAVAWWMKTRHGWEIDPAWNVPCQGVVPALNHIVRAFTAPGDRVIIQRPVYHPFTFAVERNGREVVSNSLVYENGRYTMDFDDLEAKAKDPAATMIIVCSPHNPVGRVWSAEELTRLGEICMANDVLVVMDELHMDLILNGHGFVPYATLGRDFQEKAIFTTAPSKAFSLAGIHTSNIFIADEDRRERFRAELMSSGLLGMNPLGIVSMEAAYSPEGADWLDACVDYLSGNVDYLEQALADRVPEIRLIRPEGTYLAWLDCRSFGLDKEALADLMLNDAKLFFDEGYIFGPEGEGFERINLACPRSLVEQAVDRFERVAKRFRD